MFKLLNKILGEYGLLFNRMNNRIDILLFFFFAGIGYILYSSDSDLVYSTAIRWFLITITAVILGHLGIIAWRNFKFKVELNENPSKSEQRGRPPGAKNKKNLNAIKKDSIKKEEKGELFLGGNDRTVDTQSVGEKEEEEGEDGDDIGNKKENYDSEGMKKKESKKVVKIVNKRAVKKKKGIPKDSFSPTAFDRR